jgi:hypothetical protein
MELRIPSSKKTKKDPDLLHMAEILQDFASAADHGEHLWLEVDELLNQETRPKPGDKNGITIASYITS